MKAARERAKLPEDAGIRYVEKSPGAFMELLKGLGMETLAMQRVVAVLSLLGLGAPGDAHADALSASASAASWMAPMGVAADLWWLRDVVNAKRPFVAVVHCFCGSER